MSERRHLQVSCALIERDGAVLACRRSATMKMPLKWEFPGGKIEAGESAAECLVREVLEEMAVRVSIIEPLTPVTHDYATFTVTLYPFVCSIEEGEPVLHEHAELLWLPPDELPHLDWCEADFPIIADYRERLSARQKG
ncbi:(deoxy)nucleoside triphosphate pyrophosphohydrolase [Geomesophilobacter sediminis]|uniref:8-oxo-dGTP diphosphatase n=1 Tax=Geomesophilobacter sediminis TaxID=2798584 RepID=A0A8J7IMK0_9BACT|nr:(deoxy)nucleoside triphosphate pyrophosphohydrolase [Geomesophilobacter sediminis]MBJ6723993.1 (deoxy)nucleoside triphosphate pyrophosphohydrolase [Geomesophilobacter sediminis]